MTMRWDDCLAQAAVAAVVGLGLASVSLAQVVRDGSLGSAPGGALTGPHFTIGPESGQLVCTPDNTSCNLFHSFSEFNIHAGQSATFTGPGNVANVFARVTGGSGSTIDGRLATSGMPNVDFFLINPNGVVFGPGAQLDVAGSFVVTTANEFQLADGGQLATTTDPNNSVLTTAAPNAFGFLPVDGQSPASTVPAGVTVDQSTLEVAEGQAMSVVGGDVTVTGGTLQAPSRRVNLISVASAGTIDWDVNDPAAKPNLESFTKRGDVELASLSEVFLEPQTGDLVIYAENFTLHNSQIIGTRDLVEIRLTGDVEILRSGLVIFDYPEAEVRALTIQADNALFEEFDVDVNSAPANGEITPIDITLTGDLVWLGGEIYVFGDPADSMVLSITSDNIRLFALDLNLWFNSSTNRQTGVISSQTLEIDSARILAHGVGIEIESESVLIDSSNVVATSLSIGGSPFISINAGLVEVISSFFGTLSLRGSKPGDVQLVADHILIEGLRGNSSLIASLGFAQGDAEGGDLVIDADILEVVRGGQIAATVPEDGIPGDFEISARRIVLDGQGANQATGITSGTFVGSHERVNSLLSTTRQLPPEIRLPPLGVIRPGRGGDVSVQTNELEVRNGATISVSTFGSGSGGILGIKADSVLLDGQDSTGFTGLTAETNHPVAGGTGGDINVTAGTLQILNGAGIVASTNGSGPGGSVTVNADRLVMNGLMSSIRADSTSTIIENAQFLGPITLALNLSGEGESFLLDDIIPNNISIRLVSPMNTVVYVDSMPFFDTRVLSGQFSRTGFDVTFDVIFDDNAPGFIPFGTEVGTVSGPFRPFESFKTFDGEPAHGKWSLNFSHLDLFDTHTLNSWSLAIGDSIFEATELGDVKKLFRSSGSFLSTIDVDVATDAFVGLAPLVPEDARQGGDVVINAGSMRIEHGAEISAGTFGAGEGGSVMIHTHDIIVSNGRVTTVSSSQGTAGEITMTAVHDLVIQDGAAITASARDASAGSVSLTADHNIIVLDSTISAAAGVDGGNIKLTASERVQLVDSTLTARAGLSGVGDGGQIEIDPRFVILQNSVIDGQSAGLPVEVIVDPDAIFLNSNSVILTDAASLPPELDLTGSLVALPEFLLDTQAHLEAPCATQFADDTSVFIIQPPHTIPIEPDGWLPSLRPTRRVTRDAYPQE